MEVKNLRELLNSIGFLRGKFTPGQYFNCATKLEL